MNVLYAEDDPLKYGAAGSPGFCDLHSAKMELKTQLTEQHQKQIPSLFPSHFYQVPPELPKSKKGASVILWCDG